LQVRATSGRFEERLWSIIRNFLRVSQEDPGLLVAAVQVVELQELVDAQLVAAGQAASPLRKAWRRRCLAQIGMCIQDSFAPLLQRCSQLIAAGENTDARVTEILAEADEWVEQVGCGRGWGAGPAPAPVHRQMGPLQPGLQLPRPVPSAHARRRRRLRSWPPSTTTWPPASPPSTASLGWCARSTTGSCPP
jgi:hypothetical protein